MILMTLLINLIEFMILFTLMDSITIINRDRLDNNTPVLDSDNETDNIIDTSNNEINNDDTSEEEFPNEELYNS